MSEIRENLRKLAAGAACLAGREEAVIAVEQKPFQKRGNRNTISRGNLFCVREMKKVFLFLFVLVGFGLNSFGQNTVVIQTDEKDKSKSVDECAYRISGICTTEDIGGVEVASEYSGNGYYFLEFENYNSFTVSVIFEYVSLKNKKTGTIILKPNEKKKTKETYYEPSDYKLISRKLNN